MKLNHNLILHSDTLPGPKRTLTPLLHKTAPRLLNLLKYDHNIPPKNKKLPQKNTLQTLYLKYSLEKAFYSKNYPTEPSKIAKKP